MPAVSRTLGPLHFEDLEPHRFEDLVRQLAYSFRRWRLLEPTGRLGADEGVDIRGIEIVLELDSDEPPEADDQEEDPNLAPSSEEREWIIQCKRERVITPKAIPAIVAAALQNRSAYGFILAAACDFSRKTREIFRREALAQDAHEFYMWGKGDLEDMLFRPDNDHLLFAYFGVSLVVRRRSVRTAVRSVLAAKRKAVRALGGTSGTYYSQILVRDAEDTSYPGRDKGARPGLWRVMTFRGHEPEGLRVQVFRFAAYVADDREHWDAAFALYELNNEPWLTEEEQEARQNEWQELLDVWRAFPADNRSWLRVERVMRYERIIDIDKDGDNVVPGAPHVFIDDSPPGAWEKRWEWRYIEPPAESWGSIDADPAKRISMFPPEYREMKGLVKRLSRTSKKRRSRGSR